LITQIKNITSSAIHRETRLHWKHETYGSYLGYVIKRTMDQ